MQEAAATQRIIKIRREYNTWVANETLEDYALRYAARSFRKWSFFQIANTALGGVSFLALEAIGGTIAVSAGFGNAMWAIALVSLIIFLTSLPISYYAARYAVDMDLLTRGAGFGYLGSTITSLIYASFTFIFFAIEAAIMAMALKMCFDLPIVWGYLVSSLVIVPVVLHGITWINRLQAWTQPAFLVLLMLPFVAILWQEPDLYRDFPSFGGSHGGDFDLLAIGAGCTVAVSLVSQIGEQVDFLRFLPARTAQNRGRWWAAVILAGPGWIIPGALKMLAGAFLAFVALQHMIPPHQAIQPPQMYLAGYSYLIADPRYAVMLTGVFVLLCQIKINVTNAYAGSLAWSNFFSRLTHSHPGRVVWLIFNVLIAFLLAVLGVFDALEHILGFYSCVAVSWIGALVADLVINKPLGLSPRHIEFKRAHLYALNPVGMVAMGVGSVLGIAAFGGHFGPTLRAFAPFFALLAAFVLAPLVAWATRGRYYLARPPVRHWRPAEAVCCAVCGNTYEAEDMTTCPAYGGAICSLCCTLDARCHDRCKPHRGLPPWLAMALARWLPQFSRSRAARRLSQFVLIFVLVSGLIAIIVGLVYQQELIAAEAGNTTLGVAFLRIYAVFIVLAAVGVWWLVLANESRRVAQEESERQTQLLLQEIAAHRSTDAQLQRAKEAADAANAAKSRYVRGISHELRTPLNNILGYAQILQHQAGPERRWQNALSTIQRSGEHLLALIDGLLDIARIEAGRLQVHRREVRFAEFLEHIEHMFRLEAGKKGLNFSCHTPPRLPAVVMMDEHLLRQILINLLANAVRYTAHGSITLEISYRWDVALFRITDSGCGIAEADLERIFLPFERVAHGSTPGTGLGLTITRQLVEASGGEIAVRSTLGEGSVFSVKLYLPSVASPQLAPRPEGEIRGYLGMRRRLLVVDDQPQQSQLLADMLSPRGFVVDQENDPRAVLARVHSTPPDLIFLDVAMPGLDGWQLCRALRDAGCVRPILMVSANAYDNLPDRKREAGCDDFIVKPVLEGELFARLYSWLGVEWVYARRDTSPPVAAAPICSQPDTPGPLIPQALQARLIDAAQMGHLHGLEQALDALAALGADFTPQLEHLRALTHALRFDAILDELQHAHADDPRPRA